MLSVNTKSIDTRPRNMPKKITNLAKARTNKCYIFRQCTYSVYILV